MGEPEVTPAMDAVISGPTSARTGGEIRFSKIDENMTTPSRQHRMDLEAMESELIPESTQASDDGALLHLGKKTTTPIAQAILGTAVVELIPISATFSNDGTCNNECVIHYEGTTDAAQPVPPSPGMDSDPSAAIESFTLLLSQQIVDEDTSRVTYAAPRESRVETLLSRVRISLQRRIQLCLSYR